MKTALVVTGIAAAALFAPGAHAGRTCEHKKPSVQNITRGLALAEKTRAALEAGGAQVVVLARAGQDLSKYGLRYSHLGFAYRDSAADGTPVWRVVHKLNECGTAHAALYRQGLGEFFLDDPWRYEAAWAVPSRELQAALLPVLRDNTRVRALHHKPYSIVSYPWAQRYQQSNQWALETLAGAMSAEVGGSRVKAQQWLQSKDYQPSTLQIGPLTRMGGRMGSANVAFDDHPTGKRFSDRIETVTVDSVFDWLQRSGLGGAPQVVGSH